MSTLRGTINLNFLANLTDSYATFSSPFSPRFRPMFVATSAAVSTLEIAQYSVIDVQNDVPIHQVDVDIFTENWWNSPSIHPQGIMNVFTRFHSNSCNSCQNVSLKKHQYEPLDEVPEEKSRDHQSQ